MRACRKCCPLPRGIGRQDRDGRDLQVRTFDIHLLLCSRNHTTCLGWAVLARNRLRPVELMIELLCWSLARRLFGRIALISRPRLTAGILPSFLTALAHGCWQGYKTPPGSVKAKRKLVPSSEVSAFKECICHESFAWSCVLSISQIQSFVVASFLMHQTDWIPRHAP